MNGGDGPLPEDAAIAAAHPLWTGSHDLMAEAYRMVGAKRSKAALAELVHWLLRRAVFAERRADRLRRTLWSMQKLEDAAGALAWGDPIKPEFAQEEMPADWLDGTEEDPR